MSTDTNPIPAKAALALLGRMGPEIRLPLYALEGAVFVTGALGDLG